MLRYGAAFVTSSKMSSHGTCAESEHMRSYLPHTNASHSHADQLCAACAACTQIHSLYIIKYNIKVSCRILLSPFHNQAQTSNFSVAVKKMGIKNFTSLLFTSGEIA